MSWVFVSESKFAANPYRLELHNPVIPMKVKEKRQGHLLQIRDIEAGGAVKYS